MNLSKSDLRRSYKAKIADQDIQASARKLEQQLETLLKSEQGTWGAFAALSDEPPVQFQNLKSKVNWVYPRVEGEHIQFYNAHFDQLVFSKWGIAEPDPAQHARIDMNSLTGVCVPGLAFDKEGYRLGRGKGFYDRALQNFKGKKVGVAYSWQIAEKLPRDSFDIPMDTVVTEVGIVK